MDNKYIDYWKGIYNIGDVYCEMILDKLYDKSLLDKIENRKVMRFIGSEIPSKDWSNSKTYICGLGWRLEKLKLDPKSDVRPENFRYTRGKISRQRVIDAGIKISPNLPIGDTGLLASLLYEKHDVEKKYDIGILAHYVGEPYLNDYVNVIKAKYPNARIGVEHMGDKTKTYNDIFEYIMSCKCIVASSLHAIIFSHSFGVPVMFFQDKNIKIMDTYKFEDYFSVFENLNYDITKNNTLSEIVNRLPDIEKYQPKREEIRRIQRTILNSFPYIDCFNSFGKKLLKEVNRYNISIIEDNCCGCGSCKNVCGHNAISVVENGEFLYPKVNNDVCVSCGMCSKVCPVLNIKKDKEVYKHCAVESKDTSLRLKSSSGAVIPELMHNIISNGGVCFGVAWKEDFKQVNHILVDNIDTIKKTLGSKYVESSEFEINHLATVKELLKNDKKVLYVGTPCQIASLSQYIKVFNIDESNLYRVEIACFGVPSNKLWKDYTDKIELKYGSKIVDVKFRDKKTGWSTYSTTICFENGEELSTSYKENDYMKDFLSKSHLRKSCLNCKFKSEFNTGSDLTVGDMWGVSKLNYPNDEKGVSIVNVNTIKGKWLLDSVEGQIKKILISNDDYDKIVKFNGGISNKSKNVNFFEDKVAIMAIARLENPYVNEWCRYHLNLGVNHIYICDNAFTGEDKISMVLDDSIKDKVTIVDGYNKLNYQIPAYDMMYKKYHQQYDYMMALDLDEFLVLKKHSSVQEYIGYLNKIHPGFEAVAISWRIYDDNNIIERDIRIPVMKSFTHAMDSSLSGYSHNHSSKSIVRCKEGITYKSAHNAVRSDGLCLNTLNGNGDDITSKLKMSKKFFWIESPVYDMAQINHYCTKSISEYIYQKLQRPDAAGVLKRTIDNRFFLYCHKTKEKVDFYDNYLKMKDYKVVISFTSWKNRINELERPIKSFLSQTVKCPVFLNLSIEEFPNKEKDLPMYLNNLVQNNMNLHINWLFENTKCYKKSMYLSKKLGEKTIIIATDDDLVMPKNAVERVLKVFDYKNPMTCFNRATKVGYNGKMLTNSGVFYAYTKDMINHWESILCKKITDCNDDDRFMLAIFWLNGYMNKPFKNISVGEIHNAMLELSNPISTVKNNKYIDKAKNSDSVINNKVSTITGKHLYDSFGYFNNGKSQNSDDLNILKSSSNNQKTQSKYVQTPSQPKKTVKVSKIQALRDDIAAGRVIKVTTSNGFIWKRVK